MTKQEEKDLKNKIAYIIGTRPNFIAIRSAVLDGETYNVQATYKGFYYLVRLQDNKVVQLLREVG